MKNFSQFIGEAKEAKKCPDGQYWCFDDKKCKITYAGVDKALTNL